MRVLLAVLFAALFASLTYAQSGLTSTTCPGTGCVQFQVDGARTVAFQVTGTFVGTDVFEQSNDAANWQPLWLKAPTPTRAIVGTNPAATAEVAETVPAGSRWRLRSLSVSLVTNATAGTRGPALDILDGAGNELYRGGTATQAISLNIRHTWASGISVMSSAVNGSIGPAPFDLLLLPTWQIKTLTGNIQTGDDYGAPAYVVDEEVSQTTTAGIWSGPIDGARFVRHRLSAYTSGTAFVTSSAAR